MRAVLPTSLFLLGALLKECGYGGELGWLGVQTVRFVHLWGANVPASLCPDKRDKVTVSKIQLYAFGAQQKVNR